MTFRPWQTSPLVESQPVAVELCGPAGSGKTTLRKLLCENDPRFVTATLPTSFACARQLPWAAVNTLVTCGRQCRGDRHFTWAEIRSMLYLRAWPRSLQCFAYRNRVALFDHGPAYRLAALREFGPKRLPASSLARWWEWTLERWSRRLSLVVWLDAPNAELVHRIYRRAQAHACKTLATEEAAALLDRYRAALDRVLSTMQEKGTVKVLRLASDQKTPLEIAQAVKDELAVDRVCQHMPECQSA